MAAKRTKKSETPVVVEKSMSEMLSDAFQGEQVAPVVAPVEPEPVPAPVAPAPAPVTAPVAPEPKLTPEEKAMAEVLKPVIAKVKEVLSQGIQGDAISELYMDAVKERNVHEEACLAWDKYLKLPRQQGIGGPQTARNPPGIR